MKLGNVGIILRKLYRLKYRTPIGSGECPTAERLADGLQGVERSHVQIPLGAKITALVADCTQLLYAFVQVIVQAGAAVFICSPAIEVTVAGVLVSRWTLLIASGGMICALFAAIWSDVALWC